MIEIEEIIKWLNRALDAPSTTYVLAYNSAIKEAVEKLEYMDKHRWHDLREDPDDLPEIGERIVYIFKCDGFVADNTAGYYENRFDTDGGRYEYIAWKYIEEFDL